MEKKNLLLLLMLTATAINAIGQSGFLRLPGSSYIDNVADSEAVKLGMLPAPMGEQRDERFWITRKTTATYSFAHNQAKYRGTDPQDTHAFVPELFLESAGGWSLNVGGLYAHSSYRQEFLGFLGSPGYRVEVEGNTYGISVQPAYDTFSFWNPENRPEFMKHSKLVTGLGFAYTHDDVEARFNSVSGATKYGTDGSHSIPIWYSFSRSPRNLLRF